MPEVKKAPKDPDQITHVMVKNRKGLMYGLPLDRVRELLFPPSPAPPTETELVDLAKAAGPPVIEIPLSIVASPPQDDNIDPHHLLFPEKITLADDE